jgi:hypothetical protein
MRPRPSPSELAELPPPPTGRSGWPSTPDEQAPSRGTLSVSVVTPSFNQGSYVETTIRSVLLQHYPGLEYFVIDGGSTDGSRETIDRYADHLDYWESEPDRGQAHAINKGFSRASGEILAWLNSDDYYLPGAIARAVAAFDANPSVDLLYGDCLWLDPASGALRACPAQPYSFDTALRGRSPIWQPGAFFRRTLLERVGPLDESFRYALDFDLWLRACTLTQPFYIGGPPIAVITDHPDTKSRRDRGEVVFESTRAVERFLASSSIPEARRVEREALAHLYVECAASAVLTHGSPLEALPWFARAVRRDPRVLAQLPSLTTKIISWMRPRSA